MNSKPRSGGPPSTPYEEDYICADCGHEQTIVSTQPVLCKECDGRIFRKIKTSNTIQYIAR